MTNSSPSQQLAQLWRTRPHRLPDRGPIAGVSAAFGYRYNVDPTLVRIAFVVSTIFGGAGLFLYLFTWLTLPRAGSGYSMADMLLGRGRSGDSQTAAVLVSIATVISLIGAPFGVGLAGAGPLSFIAMGAAWWLLYKRTPNPPAEYPLTAPGTTPGVAGPIVGGGSEFGQASTAWNTGVPRNTGATWNAYSVLPERYEPDPAATTRPTPTDATAGDAVTGGPEQARTADDATDAGLSLHKGSAPHQGSPQTGPSLTKGTGPQPGSAAPRPTHSVAPPSWDPLGVAPFAWDLPDPNRSTAPESNGHRRSHYTSKVIGAAIVITAATAGIGLATGGDWVTAGRLAAVALLVIGLGLVFGGLIRRGYGLLFVAAPLAAVAVAASVVPSDVFTLDAETSVSGETTTLRPQSQDDISASYANGFGEFTLDLSDINLDADRTVDITTRFGETTVIVPADMRVEANCDAKMAGALCDVSTVGSSNDPVLTLDMSARFADVKVVRND